MATSIPFMIINQPRDAYFDARRVVSALPCSGIAPIHAFARIDINSCIPVSLHPSLPLPTTRHVPEIRHRMLQCSRAPSRRRTPFNAAHRALPVEFYFVWLVFLDIQLASRSGRSWSRDHRISRQCFPCSPYIIFLIYYVKDMDGITLPASRLPCRRPRRPKHPSNPHATPSLLRCVRLRRTQPGSRARRR